MSRSSSTESPHVIDCEVCGFGLWLPIMRMTESEIGLYSDSRFPGRCIVTMREHFDHISDVPAMKLVTFMEEVQFSVDAIKAATACDRVNVAILGNAESHVHAHLIPRRPALEPFPNKAPWEDDRPKEQLAPSVEDILVSSIRAKLRDALAASVRPPIALVGRRKPRHLEPSTPDVPLFDMLSDSLEEPHITATNHRWTFGPDGIR